MKYRKLYERVVDNLVADGLIAAPTYAPEGRAMPGADRATLAENTVVAALALSRVYALCYDDAPIALSIVSQVAREFGVNLDTMPDGDAGPAPVTRWQCEGCTFATADVERMSGHYRATGHMNRRAVPEQVPDAERAHGERYESAPAAARMNPAPGLVYAAHPAWQAAALEDQAVALRKVLDVLRRAALEQQAHNREDGKRLGPDHMVEVTVGRVRLVVSDAARELGVTL
jgi:hypothetical protein